MNNTSEIFKTISLSTPYICGNEWKYLKDCLDTGWVSSVGPYVDLFENKLAENAGTEYAIAVASGTAALHTALVVAGVRTNDEVIVPDITFIAPVNAVHYVGAIPVFMDCDEYLNVDTQKIRQFCTDECRFDGKNLINRSSGRPIKAIVAVHVFGHLVDLEPLVALTKKYNLVLIEDAAEAIGSHFTSGPLAGKKAGSVGNIGCFSFNGNKIITSGGGGMITTNHETYAKAARYYTTQARDNAILHRHDHVGFNYRLTNLQAAMGLAQLEQLDVFIKIKRDIFNLYRVYLKNIPGIHLIAEPPYARSNYWLCTIHVDERAFGKNTSSLFEHLTSNGIEARRIWIPNHLQKPNQTFLPYFIERANSVPEHHLNLPSDLRLTESDIEMVCEKIRSFGE